MGIKIGYEAKLLTPVSTAETGTIGKEIDVEVKRDKNGMPYFSAKHIKGIFRGKVLEFRNAFAGNSEKYFGDSLTGEKFVEKYFGSEGNNPSKIRFSDLKLKTEKNQEEINHKIGDRYGVKINRKTRVAEDNSLFNYEFVKSKNVFAGNFEISDNFFEKNQDKTNLEKNLKFLLASFLHIDKIGGLKSRGLGKVELRVTSVEIDKKHETLEKENDRFETIERLLEIILKNKPKKIESKKLKELKKYNYTLNFLEPSVLQGKVRQNGVELRNSLQGSSIRGAIIQYGLDNNFKIEDLLKIKIAEVKKIVKKGGDEKEEFKLASGFKTKYPVKNNKPEKIDKAISVMKEYKTYKDESGIKFERDSLSLLNAEGTELSIKIDEKTRTTKESYLFSTEYMDLTNVEKGEGISFKGIVEIPEGLFEIGKEYELKIGKYKTKGFGKVEIKFEKYSKKQGMSIRDRIEKLNNQIKEDFVRFDDENNKKSEEEREKVCSGDEKLKEGKQKLITFDFLSDMILPFNEVSNVGDQILILFDENFGEKLTLNSRRTFVNVEKLRGYNIVNNMRKMDEIVITQGSVISYCVDNEDLEGILKEKELEKIEKDGIGLRRNEGFGRVRICSEREFKVNGGGNE